MAVILKNMVFIPILPTNAISISRKKCPYVGATEPFAEKSTLVQVMTWCHQTRQYPSQCWLNDINGKKPVLLKDKVQILSPRETHQYRRILRHLAILVTWNHVIIGLKHPMPCIVRSEARTGSTRIRASCTDWSSWPIRASDLIMLGTAC